MDAHQGGARPALGRDGRSTAMRCCLVGCLTVWGLVGLGTLEAEPVRFPDNGHFYEAVDPLIITWQAAKDLTESRGGYLATITSDAENVRNRSST